MTLSRYDINMLTHYRARYLRVYDWCATFSHRIKKYRMKWWNNAYYLPSSTSDADSLIRTNSSIAFCDETKVNAVIFFIVRRLKSFWRNSSFKCNSYKKWHSRFDRVKITFHSTFKQYITKINIHKYFSIYIVWNGKNNKIHHTLDTKRQMYFLLIFQNRW